MTNQQTALVAERGADDRPNGFYTVINPNYALGTLAASSWVWDSCRAMSAEPSLHEPDVTPEMLSAGVKALALFDAGDPWEWVVTEVYRAMETAKAPPSPKRLSHAPSPTR